jgi:hypothetical protein
MKKGHPLAKIAKNGTFLGPKKGKLQCAHFTCPFFEFFPHNPLPTSLPVLLIHLELPNMIPWSLTATIKLLYLNFMIIIFYCVQVFKFKNKPSYISIGKPVTLFVKTSITLASFAWCPASGFSVPCPNLTSVSTAIVNNSG